MATNLAQQSSPATAGAPAAAPAANGSGGPILLQYANYLGMDVVADSDLLWIAQQALTAELPPGWTEHADPTTGDNYCATLACGLPVLAFATFALPLTVLGRQITTRPPVRLYGSTHATPTTETCMSSSKVRSSSAQRRLGQCSPRTSRPSACQRIDTWIRSGKRRSHKSVRSRKGRSVRSCGRSVSRGTRLNAHKRRKEQQKNCNACGGRDSFEGLSMLSCKRRKLP